MICDCYIKSEATFMVNVQNTFRNSLLKFISVIASIGKHTNSANKHETTLFAIDIWSLLFEL